MSTKHTNKVKSLEAASVGLRASELAGGGLARAPLLHARGQLAHHHLGRRPVDTLKEMDSRYD